MKPLRTTGTVIVAGDKAEALDKVRTVLESHGAVVRQRADGELSARAGSTGELRMWGLERRGRPTRLPWRCDVRAAEGGPEPGLAITFESRDRWFAIRTAAATAAYQDLFQKILAGLSAC